MTDDQHENDAEAHLRNKSPQNDLPLQYNSPSTSPKIVDDNGEDNVTSQRFYQWILLNFFSGVVITASANRAIQGSKRDNVAVFCAVTSTALSAVFLYHHMQTTHKGTDVFYRHEGKLILLLTTCWIACVTIFTGVGDLSVESSDSISNANLYYFSWASFAMCVVLGTSYLKEVHWTEGGKSLSNSRRFSLWCGMLVASLVVTGTCSNVYHSKCRRIESLLQEEEAMCSKTGFGIVMGICCSCFVMLMARRKYQARATYLEEIFCSGILVFAYSVTLAIATSTTGPGAKIGNVYYSLWASFLIGVKLIENCFEQYHEYHQTAIVMNNAVNLS